MKMSYDHKFMFSIIVPVYNVEEYLSEAVESVIKQDIGFENCQLLLIDDGSTDGSGAICDAYAKKYPRNIVAIHQQNSGLSAARNAGLDHAEGKYIHMLDPDDKVSPDAYSAVFEFFEEHQSEIDIVDIPTEYFEASTGVPAWSKNKFNLGSRIVDLLQEYWILQCRVAFYKAETVKHFRFKTELKTAEDIDFNIRILIENPRLGSCAKGVYYYRRREKATSIMNVRDTWEDTYTHNTEEITFSIFKKSIEKFGRVPEFIQELALLELAPKMRAPVGELISKEGAQKFFAAVDKVLADVDDQVITNSCVIYGARLLWLMCRKHHKQPEFIQHNRDLRIVVDGITCGRLNKKFLLKDAEIAPDGDVILTAEIFLPYGRESEFSVFGITGEKICVEGIKTGDDEVLCTLGESVYTRRTIALRLPKVTEPTEYRFVLHYRDQDYPYISLIKQEDFPTCLLYPVLKKLIFNIGANKIKFSTRSLLRDFLSSCKRKLEKLFK